MKPKATATFKCELFKDTPNWKWFKGDEEIPTDPTNKTEVKKVGKDLTLTIKNAQPGDVGEYAIEVEGRRYAAKLTLGGGLGRLSIYYLTAKGCFCISLNTLFVLHK